MLTITLDINGMRCGGCVASIYHALDDVAGVTDVAVSLRDHQAILNINPNLVSPKQIEIVISNLGYKPLVKSTSRNFISR